MSRDADDERFRQLFDEYYDDVRAYCLRRLPPDEAADAVSEVFLIAWRRHAHVPEGSDARLWMYGVARNVVRNAHRSARRRQRLVARVGSVARSPERDPLAIAIEDCEQREILAALGRLNKIDQEVLQLRLWEDLSVAEVAAVFDCGPKAASKRYQRAIKRLANELGETTDRRMRPHLAKTEEVSSD